jgi:hypothetical protein
MSTLFARHCGCGLYAACRIAWRCAVVQCLGLTRADCWKRLRYLRENSKRDHPDPHNWLGGFGSFCAMVIGRVGGRNAKPSKPSENCIRGYLAASSEDSPTSRVGCQDLPVAVA